LVAEGLGLRILVQEQKGQIRYLAPLHLLAVVVVYMVVHHTPMAVLVAVVIMARLMAVLVTLPPQPLRKETMAVVDLLTVVTIRAAVVVAQRQ
jgi:hypothetical protein